VKKTQAERSNSFVTNTLEEFQTAMASVFEDFKNNQIDTVRNISIYLQPCAKSRIIRLYEDGEEVEHLIYDFAQQQKVSMVSANLSVVKAHKVKKVDNDDK